MTLLLIGLGTVFLCTSLYIIFDSFKLMHVLQRSKIDITSKCFLPAEKNEQRRSSF
jgi:hypothetical protein